MFNLTLEIAPCGSFVATARSIGITEEEARKGERGEWHPDAVEVAAFMLKNAAAILAATIPKGRC